MRPSLAAYLRLLLRHAAFTVGGGAVTTVALERDLLERQWLDRDSFRAYYGLARLTPGTVLLALVTAIGWHLFRWRGAVIGLVVASLPGCALAAFLTEAQSLSQQNALGRAFFAGASAGVCGLLAATIWRVVEPYLDPVRRWGSVAVLALSALAGLYDFSPFLLILAAALAGFFLQPREEAL